MLIIDQIIKHVMISATEAELVSLIITARECFELLQSLTEICWPQNQFRFKYRSLPMIFL